MARWPYTREINEDGGKESNDLLSRLLQERIIMLCGTVDEDMAASIVSQLLFLEQQDPDSDITIYIYSPGGSVTAGMSIYDTMNFIKPDIRTVGLGMSASMAAFLLCSGTPGKRYVLPNSEVMIHQPLGGTQGQATEIEIAYRHISGIKKKMYEIMAKNTGKSFEEIEAACDRDHYLTAEEAVEFGLVDKILQRETNKEEETNE